MKKLLGALLCLATCLPCLAQKPRWFNTEAQLTYVYQRKPGMGGGADGPRSLMAADEQAATITSTVFVDLNLHRNLTLKVNPEVATGGGLSGVNGIAAFPNGEAFRIGGGSPYYYLARAVLEWTIPLSGSVKVKSEDHPLNDSIPSRGLMLAAGKFCLMDYLDGNTYSHDPRDQFMNWALMSSAAYDYGADIRGYTRGVVLAWFSPTWEVDFAATQVAENINSNTFDPNLSKAYTLNLSVERKWTNSLGDGQLRLLAFHNHARMGNYAEANANPILPSLESVRQYGNTKTGFALSAEQGFGIRDGVRTGAFARLSWNDGRNESWAFTEVDHSLALGYQGVGYHWRGTQEADTWGIATVVNGLSEGHKTYLARGGLGFMLGDGSLDYGLETTLEAYYRIGIMNKTMWLSPDLQFTLNPGYNRSRGPATFLGVRLHVEV